MTNMNRMRAPGFWVLFAVLLWGWMTPCAATGSTGAVDAVGAWVRWMPAGLPEAGYLVLENTTGDEIVLTGASSPDFERVELHESITTPEGNARMRHIESVAIPAQGKLVLEPGGYHLMLMQARHPIKVGDEVTIELTFADGEMLTVLAGVKPAGQRPGK